MDEDLEDGSSFSLLSNKLNQPPNADDSPQDSESNQEVLSQHSNK